MAIDVHPNNKRAVISEDSLRELYVAQGLTLENIATRFGTSPTTLRRRFADVGIAARPHGPVPTCTGASLSLAACRWSSELATSLG